MKNNALNKICLSLSDKNAIPISKNLEKYKDFIFEIRIDLFDKINKTIQKILKSDNKIIITCRGKNCTNKKKLLWAKSSKNILAIDIEFNTQSLKNDIEYFSNYPLILSYHNYNETPNFQVLSDLFEKMQSLNPDFVKIVTYDKNKDYKNLQKLYNKANKINLIAFTLGCSSLESRVCVLQKGAPFVFASPSKDNAVFPGQPYYEDILNKYYGK